MDVEDDEDFDFGCDTAKDVSLWTAKTTDSSGLSFVKENILSGDKKGNASLVHANDLAAKGKGSLVDAKDLSVKRNEKRKGSLVDSKDLEAKGNEKGKGSLVDANDCASSVVKEAKGDEMWGDFNIFDSKL